MAVIINEPSGRGAGDWDDHDEGVIGISDSSDSDSDSDDDDDGGEYHELVNPCANVALFQYTNIHDLVGRVSSADFETQPVSVLLGPADCFFVVGSRSISVCRPAFDPGQLRIGDVETSPRIEDASVYVNRSVNIYNPDTLGDVEFMSAFTFGSGIGRLIVDAFGALDGMYIATIDYDRSDLESMSTDEIGCIPLRYHRFDPARCSLMRDCPIGWATLANPLRPHHTRPDVLRRPDGFECELPDVCCDGISSITTDFWLCMAHIGDRSASTHECVVFVPVLPGPEMIGASG